jgi:hypothetical protein
MSKNFNKTVLSCAIALAAFHSGTAAAHSIAGAVAPGGSDVYNFQCFTDRPPLSEGTSAPLAATRVSVRLVSASGSGVSAQLGHISKGITTQNWRGQVTDTTTGATPVFLVPPATKTAGVYSDSGYNLVVRNISTVARSYNVEFHCLSGGLHSGTGALFSNSQNPTADLVSVINN